MPDRKNNPVFNIELFTEKIFVFIFRRSVKVIFFKDIPGGMKPECYNYPRINYFNLHIKIG